MTKLTFYPLNTSLYFQLKKKKTHFKSFAFLHTTRIKKSNSIIWSWTPHHTLCSRCLFSFHHHCTNAQVTPILHTNLSKQTLSYQKNFYISILCNQIWPLQALHIMIFKDSLNNQTFLLANECQLGRWAGNIVCFHKSSFHTESSRILGMDGC